MNTKEQESKKNDTSGQPAADCQTEELADLSIATEQTEQIKGGALAGLHKAGDVALKRGVIG